jgi:hypothetical protein
MREGVEPTTGRKTAARSNSICAFEGNYLRVGQVTALLVAAVPFRRCDGSA